MECDKHLSDCNASSRLSSLNLADSQATKAFNLSCSRNFSSENSFIHSFNKVIKVSRVQIEFGKQATIFNYFLFVHSFSFRLRNDDAAKNPMRGSKQTFSI